MIYYSIVCIFILLIGRSLTLSSLNRTSDYIASSQAELLIRRKVYASTTSIRESFIFKRTRYWKDIHDMVDTYERYVNFIRLSLLGRRWIQQRWMKRQWRAIRVVSILILGPMRSTNALSQPGIYAGLLSQDVLCVTDRPKSSYARKLNHRQSTVTLSRNHKFT